MRLLEVFQKLVDNALKYMGDQKHPKIDISAEPDGDRVRCSVRDNGKGIEQRYHEKIFGLFNQLEPETEGSGIGLAIIRRIVEIHHG